MVEEEGCCGLDCVFFFPCAAVVCGCGWRGNGGGGRCCCDGLIFEAGVYHYFNEVFILL